MKRRKKKHETKVKKLLVAAVLCTIILIVSTYAWFIGMKVVNVSSFDVSIAAIDSLLLSLDGKNWETTVTINEENHKTVSYDGNTNSWGGKGLVPVSSVGKIDTGSSRLIMYEKGSFTASPGGYRVMAARVQNTGAKEVDGYVAFDLFIKNKSGHAYYKELNPKNEEAIYLDPESEVKVAEDGEIKAGIENSVRVAFAQIGRVIAVEDDVDVITGITCKSNDDVTGICADRDAQIWEPNDTKHVTNAISWYTTSCRKRIGSDITNPASFSGPCKTIKDGVYYPTYAVSGVIDYKDQVDVYDGKEYNGYTKSISSSYQKGKLYKVDYFTDTDKFNEGVDRPDFITLAPNSITKVRIYIYIEGQDIDNYDFASLGRKISVSFGFTKERFYGEDIDYDGDPELPDDVVRDQTVSYVNTGEITDISNSKITYDNDKKEFTLPSWMTKFTFKDGGVKKTATRVDDIWTIN